MLLLQSVVAAAQLPPGAGSEINQSGQAFLGLGLSLLMLTGFVFVLAVVFLTPILIGWFRHDHGHGSHA